MVESPTSVQDELGLCDVVSVIPSCEDGTYLLVCPVKGKEVHWIFTGTARNISWRIVARQLILENLGYEITDENLVKVYNMWVPDDQNLHHAVFEVPFTVEVKKKIKLLNTNFKFRWFTAADVHLLASKGNLRSPELTDYLPALKKRLHNSTLPPHPEGYDLPGALMSSDDGLVEVFEDHVFVRTDGDVCTHFELLVKLANFTQKEQVLIYREFLSLCFPNLLMTYPVFEMFMANFGWKQELLPNLFHAADLCDRGALTFKDFLFILAACEPKTPHGGRPAEIRCRYIFRFFDANKDNKLDYDELKQMLITIRICRNQTVRSSSIDKELESCNKELGLSSRAELTLAQFMRSVGDLKFRGTSTLLRSPSSVIDYFMNRNSSPYSTIIDTAASLLFRGSTMCTSKAGSTSSAIPGYRRSSCVAGGSIFRRSLPGLSALSRVDKKDIFEVCGHIAKVCKEGLKHMDLIDEVPFSKTPSVTDTFLKSDSVEIFNTRFAPNEILAGLRYFTEKIDANDLNVKKFGRKPKPGYNWGQVDFNGFANCLITVCDLLSEVVAQEPRLLRINSPVYVLGDLHGNYPDLHCFETLLWKLGPNLCPCNLLFLGDYVDRGVHSVEVVSYLFSYKLLNSKKLHLIRGNHEIREVQKMFTFLTECQKKFGRELGYHVWNNVNRVFDNLPVAAIIDDKIFCCHGGIPPPWLCPTVDSINSIPCPLNSPEEQSSLAWEIMWNDPIRLNDVTDRITLELQANEGFAMNVKRGTAHMFNINALQRFLNINELSHVIRAHEAQIAGFQVHQTGKLLTVFSTSHYCGGNNEAACILVFKKELRIFRIDTN